MTSEASNLWKVSHFFHMGCITYIHTISLPRLSFFVILKQCVNFPFNCIIKQITNTITFLVSSKWSMISLHSGKTFPFRNRLFCYPFGKCIISLFDILNIHVCIEHIVRFMWEKKRSLLISDLKHKTYFV